MIDSTKEYVDFMKTLFDFDKIKSFINSGNFSMMFDGMHGVSGPYAKEIFVH